MSSLESLLSEVRACRQCDRYLPLGPRPILAAHEQSRILVIGQAPGIRVHHSGVPWDDASGSRLRTWMGLDREIFYDTHCLALVPMGFCFPGSGSGGDFPPRTECKDLWHERLLRELQRVQLTLLVGRFAQNFCLANRKQSTLTKTVQSWRDYRPKIIPLPHPSPRNNRWFKSNPWFVKQVVPYLQRRVRKILSHRT